MGSHFNGGTLRLLLEESHCNYRGMSRMKSLTRNYLLWPQLNTEIEAIARICQQCCAVGPNPPAAQAHPWLLLVSTPDPLEKIAYGSCQRKKWLLYIGCRRQA